MWIEVKEWVLYKALIYEHDVGILSKAWIHEQGVGVESKDWIHKDADT